MKIDPVSCKPHPTPPHPSLRKFLLSRPCSPQSLKGLFTFCFWPGAELETFQGEDIVIVVVSVTVLISKVRARSVTKEGITE